MTAHVIVNAVGADAKTGADWMSEVASNAVLEEAFSWLCHRRADYEDSADVWNVRRHWKEFKLRLQHDLLRGRYRFSPSGESGWTTTVSNCGRRSTHWC